MSDSYMLVPFFRLIALKALASLPWRANQVVLYCHDVGPISHPMCIPSEVFLRQMQTLARDGWQVGTLSGLLELAQTDSIPTKRYAALCFDDGLRGVYTYAMPILQNLGFLATVFVSTDYIGARPVWPGMEDYIKAAVNFATGPRVMNVSELCELQARGWEIGSHGASHRDLRRMSHVDLSHEIEESKEILESLLRTKVATFCYPYGHQDCFVRKLTRASGYAAACGIAVGHGNFKRDLFSLPRIHLDPNVDGRTLRAMLSILFPTYTRISKRLKNAKVLSGMD